MLLGRPAEGAIDRLVVGKATVLAVDFKSNRLVPDRPDEVPEAILRQMGAYAALLAQIWPGGAVQTAMLVDGNRAVDARFLTISCGRPCNGPQVMGVCPLTLCPADA